MPTAARPSRRSRSSGGPRPAAPGGPSELCTGALGRASGGWSLRGRLAVAVPGPDGDAGAAQVGQTCRSGTARPGGAGQEGHQVVERRPVRGIFGKAPADDFAEWACNALQVGRLARDAMDDSGNGGRIEGPAPRGRIGENPTEGEDVAPAADVLTADLFGRHRREGADEHPGRRQGGCVRGPGDAKSMILGPSSARMMLLGFRSLWTRPHACTAASPSADAAPPGGHPRFRAGRFA